MVVLALETVTRAGSLALWEDGVCQATVGDPARTHGERLPREVTTFLAGNGRTLADVDLFAVVSGPGSFTGLRVGIAAAQGFALAGHRRLVGIPTLDALTTTWRDVHPEPALIVACLDGQRGDVYFGAVDVLDASLDLDACPRVIEPTVSKPEDAAAMIHLRADRRRTVVVGDGAVRYEAAFRSAIPGVEIAEAPKTLAEAAAGLAARHPDRAGAPHAIRPFYLRQTDAELARKRAERAAEGFTAAQCLIRRAGSADDLLAVEALQQATFTNAWGADAIRWELENTDVARLYVMVAPTGHLLAYCACWVVFDELHINSFAVDPAWRRRGLARHFLRQVLAEGVGAGARSATLEVRQSNIPARHLYEGFGFRVEGTRRDYYQDPREDALILWHRSLS